MMMKDFITKYKINIDVINDASLGVKHKYQIKHRTPYAHFILLITICLSYYGIKSILI